MRTRKKEPIRDNQFDEKLPESEDSLDEYSEDGSSGSAEEVSLNILERQPRITAGDDEQVDRSFWGSEQHRTWEESESDSDVSYDIDEEDEEEEELESELDDEQEDEEGEEEEEEEDDEDERRRKRPRFQAYKAPTGKDEPTKKKTVVVRKQKTPVTPISIAESERRETRDSTRARTLEVMSKPVPDTAKKSKTATTTPRGTPHQRSQEELMEEAKIVEEWNKADYDAYIRFTELSEKERTAFLQKRRPKGPKNAYSIVSRSFIKEGEVCSEIKVVPPVLDELPVTAKKKDSKTPPVFTKSVSDVLGIVSDIPSPADRTFKYRYPYGSMECFNTVEECQRLRERESAHDAQEALAFISYLESLLIK